jgi:hypothetical protein
LAWHLRHLDPAIIAVSAEPFFDLSQSRAQGPRWNLQSISLIAREDVSELINGGLS